MAHPSAPSRISAAGPDNIKTVENLRNTMTNQTVSSLNDIQPSRVVVGFWGDSCLNMMRIEGTDNVV